MKIVLGLLLLLPAFFLHASSDATWFTREDGKQVRLQVDLFLSSTCPHCHKADAFFRELEKTKPWLVVHRYVINQEKEALKTFYERLQQQNSENFLVPSIFFCDSRWSGFAGAESSGKALLQALNYCHRQISQQGELNQGTINTLRQWGIANQFEIKANVAKSSGRFLLLASLMDAFSPCSLFAFAAFFAFLWLFPKHKWRQFSVGMLFIVSLGFIHYIGQAHSAFYYQLIPWLRWPAAILGGVLLFYIVYKWPKMISGSEPRSFVLISLLIILTTVAVQIYQQTCTLNVALIFEEWLTQQRFSTSERLAYHLVYQILFLLPLTLLLLLYLFLSRARRFPRYNKAMKFSACLILMVIGGALIIYPLLLAHLWVSLMVLIASILCGWLFMRLYD